MDLSKNFYFSYTYDITQSLQVNLTKKVHLKISDMFMWNFFLTRQSDDLSTDWILPIIHGFVDQASK